MAQFKKLTQSEVYNELQNNARNIHASYGRIIQKKGRNRNEIYRANNF